MRERGTEVLSELPKFTQQVGMGVRNQASLHHDLIFSSAFFAMRH